MSVACSINSDQASHCDLEDAMAVQPATKRARVEIVVPAYSAVQLNEFTLKDNGKGENGHKASPLVAGTTIRFNLTPDGWLKTPFGFDVDSKFEKPSFLGGKDPKRAGIPEGLNLRFNLQQAEIEFLQELDDAAKRAFAELAKATWNPMLSENALYNSTSVKATVVLKGDDLTEIAVVADNKVTRGEGWEFLKGFIDEGNTFKHADVKLTVRVTKLWHVGGKAGLKLQATQLVLRPSEKPREAAAFADDWALLA